MRITVTPVGITPGAARRIASYLMSTAPQADRPFAGSFPDPPGTGTGPGTATGTGRVAGYYRSDQLEGDGWWAGRGADRLGLAGRVDGGVLESLLMGRHPVTGERLLSARGSAGRGSLKAGNTPA